MDTYLHNAPCVFFSCTDNGLLTDWNNTLCTTLEYSREELEGKKVDFILTLASRIFQQTHFFPLLKMQGYATEIFITLQTKNNEQVPVLINAERQDVDGQTRFVHAGIIVYNRKKYEDELIAAKKEAEAALQQSTALMRAKEELQRRIEQLDDQIHLTNVQNAELKLFNRMITHDLQEPLRKLSLFGSMFLDGRKLINQKRILEKLLQTSEQMRSIVYGLQQYLWVRDIITKPAKVDLGDLLTNVQQQLKNEFTQVNLMVEFDSLPTIIADPEQMQVLFYQLLSNAIRFRKEETAVHVRVSTSSLMLNKFRNVKDKYMYQEFLKLQLKDNGVGFDSVYKEQVFELFRHLHSVSGQGIGLSICRKIVDTHGGTISIESAKCEGTLITIFMPIAQHE